MGIRQEIDHAKNLFDKGTDLLLLRLQMLALDLSEQAESTFAIMLSLLLAAVMLFAAVLAALFGLNRLLGDAWAVGVFFAITAFCLLAAFLFFRRIGAAWRKQRAVLSAAVAAVRDDLACLRGETAAKERGDE